jgi:alkylation response protein AidB-like acyl-CoA dehydrogenase
MSVKRTFVHFSHIALLRKQSFREVTLNLEFTPQQRAFRDEVRAFIDDNCPAEIRKRLSLGHIARKEDTVLWQRMVNAKGWAGVGWPKDYGGTGWSPVERMIFLEECMRTPTPDLQGFNLNMIGPVLMEFGSDEQKRRFLPRLLNLDDWWCQGFSEPEAGSDLAALKTAATRDGDVYVVKGSKIWTSLAQHADWMFCLVRTDPAARKRQEGISFLLIDMKTPGITVRPIVSIDGSRHLNEVFLDDVRVPVAMRVGEEDRGWTYAKYLLSNERMGVAKVGRLKERLDFVRKLAARIDGDGAPLIEDCSFRERLAQLDVEIKALELTQLRLVASQGRPPSGQPDPFSSILKLRASELLQSVLELIMDAGGPVSNAVWDTDAAGFGDEAMTTLAPPYLFARSATIYGGSSEIQKNILAKSVLGL